jgi:hypothetical protein
MPKRKKHATDELAAQISHALDSLVEDGELITDGKGNYRFPGSTHNVITPPDDEEERS